MPAAAHAQKPESSKPVAEGLAAHTRPCLNDVAMNGRATLTWRLLAATSGIDTLHHFLRSHLSRRADVVTLGVRALVVDNASRVLLVRHTYRPGWHFPGGGVERNEAIDAALARETFEEAGIVPTAPARLFGIYANFKAYPGDHVVLFIIEHWRRDHVPAPNAEIVEQGFFALDQLPQSLSPGTARRLEEVFGGAERSEDW